MLPNKVYQTLKWLALVFLPAVAALYSSLGGAFNLPYPQEISATIAALIVFLGVFLQVNSAAFKFNVVKERGQEVASYLVKQYFVLSNSMYDALKWISTILLPALSTLYVAVAHIWNLPYGEDVSNAIAAIVLFMAAFLQISSYEYRASMHVVSSSLDKPKVVWTRGLFAMTSETYNWLKFVAQGLLPGLATFYVALATIWKLPYGEQVSATIMAVVLFMNSVLQISTAKFRKAQAS